MKKICLLFALSIVFVFSVSAQTSAQINDKSTGNINAVEKVKVEAASTKTAVELVKTPVETSQKDSSAQTPKSLATVEQKPQTAETQKPQPAEEQKSETGETAKKPEVIEAEKKPETVEPVKYSVVVETVAPEKKPEPEQPKAETSESVKKPEEPVLEEKKTLGALSTGNTAVDGYIEEFSALYGVDPLLIYAQMSQESSFRARATSSKGASGYMQLMPDTARRFGVTNIYNPKQNIRAGIKYMSWLLDKFGGSVELALAGYNAGEGSVMKYGNKIPPYRETRNYVAKIMAHYNLISDQDSTLAKND